MQTSVMVNGLPGNMAKEIIETAQDRGLTVVPFSCTGPGVELNSVTVQNQEITLITPETRDTQIKEVIAEHGPFITVDFTHPTAVNANADFYIANSLPFVMGTTGGDRQKLTDEVLQAQLYSVIAPNMAKQIVALQAMLEEMQKSYPGVYEGYTLSVIESHQKQKADTSGTAKAIVDTFNQMGIEPITYDDITKVRTEDEQQSIMEVPADFIDGHAYHTYRIEAKDKSNAFEFRHNVNGRRIYAEGTIDAVLFLDKQRLAETKQTLFTMIDILKSGDMN